MNVDEVKALATRIRAEIGKAIVGQDETVELMLIALFAGGHILLEGPPGTAKTFLAQCFARALGLDFGRIQFTPDLMPGDILGSNLFNFQTSQFTLTRGPIFCDLLLADEINRTPPKTQAALLEAMQERAVTIDGEPRIAVAALHGGRDPEPDRAAGRLSAARGAARPLPVQAAGDLSAAPRRSGRSSPLTAHALRRAAARGLGDRRRSTAPALAAAVATVGRVTAGRRDRRLCRRAGPRDARQRRPRERRLARARRRCWPARRGRAPRSTAATMSSPTTSRRWRPAVAPPRDAVARRRDRRPAGRRRSSPTSSRRWRRRVDLPEPPRDPGQLRPARCRPSWSRWRAVALVSRAAVDLACCLPSWRWTPPRGRDGRR